MGVTYIKSCNNGKWLSEMWHSFVSSKHFQTAFRSQESSPAESLISPFPMSAMPATSKIGRKGDKAAVITSFPFKKNLEESLLRSCLLHLQHVESEVLLTRAKTVAKSQLLVSKSVKVNQKNNGD
jgi:hypothetical protein